MNEEDDDSIKTLVLKHLQPSVITFGDELNLSAILGKNIDNDILASGFPVSSVCQNEGKLRESKCSVCHKVFPSKRYLNRHFSKHTSQFKCSFCEKVFCRKESLLKHSSRCAQNELAVHRPRKRVYTSQKDVSKYSCEKCSKNFTRRENYDQHAMTHYGMQVVCYVCQKILKSFKSYRRHIKNHQTDRPLLSCDLCPATFSHKSNLRRHELQQHINEITCEKCHHKVKNEKILQKHQDNESVCCSVCSELFCLKTDLRNHVKLIHHDLWFSCKACSGVTPFMTKCEYNLKEHAKRRHSITLETADCYKNGWYMLLSN